MMSRVARGAKRKALKQRNKQAGSIKASRAAQENPGLFGVDKKTSRHWRAAMGNTKKTMGDDELATAHDSMKSIRKANGQRISDIDEALAGNNVAKSQRKLLQNEREALMKDAKEAKKMQGDYMAGLNGEKTMRRDLTGMERAASGGKAVANYMWGGSAGQIAARNGAVVGGIVGLNMGMDYLDRPSSSSGGQY